MYPISNATEKARDDSFFRKLGEDQEYPALTQIPMHTKVDRGLIPMRMDETWQEYSRGGSCQGRLDWHC
jgi:hypothetical protein